MSPSENSPRTLSIQVIDPAATPSPISDDKLGDDGPRSIGVPPPCLLHVGDTAISEADIAREMQFHRSPTPQQARADAARALVVRELLRREANRLDLGSDIVCQPGEPEEEAIARILLERHVADRKPTEAECRTYYEQNRERLRTADRIQVRHILLAAPDDDAAARHEARNLGEQLIAELTEDPGRFGNFARRHSRCPSKRAGGDLGWLERGQTTPELDRQIFRLRKGLAPYPVESRWGYHVVCIDDTSPGALLTFKQAHARISDYLELQVRQQELVHYLQTLESRYEVRGLAEIEAQAAT